MKGKILGLLAVGLLAGPPIATAAILAAVDTTAEFSGSFVFSGTAGTEEFLTPTNFELGTPIDVGCGAVFGARSETLSAFGIACSSSPDNAIILSPWGSTTQTFQDVSGVYDTVLSQIATINTVYFRLFNLVDTGGATGALSGQFCFSTTRTGCASAVAEPGSLALLGLGLACLGLSRRRKAN